MGVILAFMSLLKLSPPLISTYLELEGKAGLSRGAFRLSRQRSLPQLSVIMKQVPSKVLGSGSSSLGHTLC